MDYTFLEFLARKLPVTRYQEDFYRRVQEIIPGADLDIEDFSLCTLIDEDLANACRDLEIPWRHKGTSLEVDKPSILFSLHKTLPLETILQIPNPDIFGKIEVRNKKYQGKSKEVIKGNVNYAMENINEKDLPIYYTNGAMITNDADVSVWEKIRLEEHKLS